MSLQYNKKLVPRAKELRRDMTKHEKHLWYDFLSKFPLRFQRQKTIGSFIVDFYCHEAKLIIELDGSQHYTEEALGYDRERTNILNGYGLNVMRYTNFEIEHNFDEVCKVIAGEVMKRLGTEH